MIKPISVFFLFLTFCIPLGFSQEKQRTDTPNRDSLALNEANLISSQQQKQIDSLVRIQLTKQLGATGENDARRKELEEKLHQITLNDSLRSIKQSEEINNLKAHATPYPVVLGNDTLFNIYTRTGSFSAKERAAGISRKVTAVYEDAFYNPDSLQLKGGNNSYDILYKNGEVILSISDLDGLWFGKTNEVLGKEYLQTIKAVVASERESHSLMNWAKRIGLSLLILTFLIVLIRCIYWLFGKMRVYLMERSTKFTQGIKLGNIRVIAAQDLQLLFIRINNLVRLIVILVLIYLSLPLLFSVFPETESYASTLLGWILGPLRIALHAVVDYLPRLFTILVIYLIFKYVLKAIRYFFMELRKGNIQINGFHADWAVPTFNILRFVLYAFMLVIIFPYLPGSGSAAFQGVSVFLGILISLGSSSAITNIVAGLVITYMRPFKVGDRVKVGEVTGDIMEKTMLVTRIRTIKNEEVTVPNSMVLTNSTVNYSNGRDHAGLIVHYEVTLGYDVPWRTAYALLIAAAKKSLHIQASPEPFVLQTRLNDYYVSYQVNAYTLEAGKQAAIYSSLMENIQDELNAAGIEMLSPTFTVIKNE